MLSFDLLVNSVACPADQQTPEAQLEPIVVTASAVPTPLSTAPGTVSVISREEIQNQQANRLSEVLRQVPGLNIDQMGARGGISSIYIRGGDPNFTTIMIDGIQINDPTNQRGGSVDLSTLSPEQIERIEVVRGPASSLYGSDAMAGVVNIVTRRGQDNTEYTVRGEGGRFGYGRGILQLRSSFKPINYSVSLAATTNAEQVKQDRFNLGTVGGTLDLVGYEPFTLALTGQYTRMGTRSFPEGSGGPRLSVLQETESRERNEIVLGLRLNNEPARRWRNQISATLFYANQNADNPGVQAVPGIFQIPPAKSDADYARQQLLWKLAFDVMSKWTVASGVQLTHEKGNSNGLQKLTTTGAPTDQPTRFNITRFTPAIFFENTISPLDRLKLTAGLRGDFPEKFSQELSPRVTILYHALSETEFRGSYGEAFKLPSLYSLGDPLVGNPALKPERSVGWDVGFEQALVKGKYSFGLTYFHNKFSNLVDLDPVLAQRNIFKLVNLNTVVSQGVEATIGLKPADKFFAKAHFTYLDTDIKRTDHPLRNRTRFSGGISLEIKPSEDFILTNHVTMVGKSYDLQLPAKKNVTDAFVKTDISATYSITKSWRLLAVLENFTNAKYEQYIGFPAPGINMRAGFEYSH
jgi:iron complex outermembrane receptor protein/vitamin B12 transporter